MSPHAGNLRKQPSSESFPRRQADKAIEGKRHAKMANWQKSDQKKPHSQNKLSRHQRQQKQAKGQLSVFRVFHIRCSCVCLFVCVTVNVFLVCYWTGKRGRWVCLKSVFYREPTIEGRVESKTMKDLIVWIIITSLN